jgi:streptogramin lyase
MNPLSALHAWRVLCPVIAAVLLVTQSAGAEPLAYAINSDSFSESQHDHLLRVDLATGEFEDMGSLRLGSAAAPFLDAEGLALDPEGQLWAVDDGTKTFFRIDIATLRAAIPGSQIGNLGLPTGITAGLDLGLTFACDGTAFMSGEVSKTLYRLDPSSGRATPIGALGALGYKITDLAVYGDLMVGLGSEGDEGIYSIDRVSGTALPIGNFSDTARFNDGGIGFDADGRLWAVVEEGGAVPSRVYRIDLATGRENLISPTTPGIESLALTPPQCPAAAEPLPQEVSALGSKSVGMLILGFALLGIVALTRRLSA